MPGPSGSTPISALPYPTPDDNVDVPRDIKALADKLDPNQGALIVGEVRTFGTAAAPARWRLCDGGLLAQATYPELYAAIGTRFNTGGEAADQFRLPDAQGRALVGAGAGAGLTARQVADRFGEERHLLVVAELPSHNHGGATGGGTTGGGATGGQSAPHYHGPNAGATFLQGDGNTFLHMEVLNPGGFNPTPTAHAPSTAYNSTDHTHAIPGLSVPALAIAAQGGGGAHNVVQPSLALLTCIYAGR